MMNTVCGGFKTPPQVIRDIGANLGLLSLFAKSLVPAACIPSYEPGPEVARTASKNLSHFAAVTVWNEAIGGQAGRCGIQPQVESRHTQTKVLPNGLVVVTSSEESVQRAGGKVVLVKLDCEGAEWEIFTKAAHILAEIPAIRLEYHLIENHSLSELTELAEGANHRITHLKSQGNHGIAWMTTLGD